MTERERWIVYPLLFFALGAALRDKFLHQVTTKEVYCERLVTESISCDKGIACGGVVVFNPDNSQQPLVQLGLLSPDDMPGVQSPTKLGVLILRDSKGRELCGVSNNELFVRRISCEGIGVIDPNRPGQPPLAGLSTALATAEPGARPQKVGVLLLNNQAVASIRGQASIPVVPEGGSQPPAGPEGAGPEDSEKSGEKSSPQPPALDRG